MDSLGGERESFSAIGVEITLRRKYLPFIIDYYLPSGLFVVVSWVCESARDYGVNVIGLTYKSFCVYLTGKIRVIVLNHFYFCFITFLMRRDMSKRDSNSARSVGFPKLCHVSCVNITLEGRGAWGLVCALQC